MFFPSKSINMMLGRCRSLEYEDMGDCSQWTCSLSYCNSLLRLILLEGVFYVFVSYLFAIFVFFDVFAIQYICVTY